MTGRTGATLIELLIALAVLATMLAVAAPAMRRPTSLDGDTIPRMLRDSLDRAVRERRDIRLRVSLATGRTIAAVAFADGTAAADSDFHANAFIGAMVHAR